jgi:hypothetical protein
MPPPSPHLQDPDQESPPLSELENLSSEQAQTALLREFDPQCQQSRLRLIQELAAVRHRSTTHLVIGVFAIAVAVGILAPAVLFEAAPSDIVQAGIHLMPRLILSLFVGAFSTFFLQLHKAAANEIRHYQNELTNIDMRLIALDRAGDAELGIVIKTMAGTERNPVLKKGDTTAELEQSKIDSQNSQELLAAIQRLLKQINK